MTCEVAVILLLAEKVDDYESVFCSQTLQESILQSANLQRLIKSETKLSLKHINKNLILPPTGVKPLL